MKNTLVLVADSTHARLFEAASSSGPLVELETLTNPEGRLHEQKITTDLPGKDADHGYESKTSPHEATVDSFARRVARHMDELRTTNKLNRLFVVAAPTFLGKLRTEFSAPVKSLVCYELAKNLGTQSSDEIRSHLPKSLAEGLTASH